MRATIEPCFIDALEGLFRAVGRGVEAVYIIPVRVCDHCRDPDKEAAPMMLIDPDGEPVYMDLCADCCPAFFVDG